MLETPTVRVVLAEARRPSRRTTVPIQPKDEEAEALAVELLRLPKGTAALAVMSRRLPESRLLGFLARTSLAHELRIEWGIRCGPLTCTASFVWPGGPNASVIRVLSVQGRLLALAELDAREEVPALEPRWLLPTRTSVQRAVGSAERFPLQWVAAVQSAALREAAAHRGGRR